MFEIIYYHKDGQCPILDFLMKLPKKDRAKILREVDLLQDFGLQLGMPHVKKMKGTDDLWELRVKQGSDNYRIFYFTLKAKRFVLLHAFQKKSQKTPKKDIEIAEHRKTDFLERGEY
ncbi:type II toxin-antitoxin system RelE/ParE family toxin [Fusibacter sp. JL216-2]|uniref:type II toxin-antitoxin system RelE/ParE family toxin n=1 Tax=Fusibacter sp. JL216-2 TaxID=3071453 RepID=UPI003D3258B6